MPLRLGIAEAGIGHRRVHTGVSEFADTLDTQFIHLRIELRPAAQFGQSALRVLLPLQCVCDISDNAVVVRR